MLCCTSSPAHADDVDPAPDRRVAVTIDDLPWQRMADTPPEALQGVDIQAMWKAIEAGEPGRIVDIQGDEGEIVEIILE